MFWLRVFLNMKPPSMPAFIPPVTGVHGNPASVVANSYDDTGNFRNRIHSYGKRRRTEGADSQDNYWNMTLDPNPPVMPNRPTLDLPAIQALLVEATSQVASMRDMLDDPSLDEKHKQLAKLTISLFNVIEAVVEKGIAPSTSAPMNARNPTKTQPNQVPGKKELREALLTADKTAILYDADLGPVSMASRAKLSQALVDNLKIAAIRKAQTDKKNAEEEFRVVDDAWGLVNDMTFLGQATRPLKKRDGTVSETINTIPVKLVFDDANTRIHFERTVRAKCDLRATVSLPKPLYELQKKINTEARTAHPGKYVSVRHCSKTLSFIVSTRAEGTGSKWTVSSSHPIDPAVMIGAQNRTIYHDNAPTTEAVMDE